MNSIRIAFLPIIRKTFDVPYAEDMSLQARSQLLSAGFDLIEAPQAITDLDGAKQAIEQLEDEPIDLMLVFYATFADSTMITTLSEATEAPLFLWAVPEPWTGRRLRLNSLCGINLAAHALTLRNRKFDYGYGAPLDGEIIKKIRLLATAGAVKRSLRSVRLGVVGQHPEGMDTCHLDATLINKIFGIQIESIDLQVVFERAKAVNDSQIAEIRAELDRHLDNLPELEQKPLNGTLRVYQVLYNIATELGLSGLAVRCWPEFFTQMGCAACGAMSMLSDGFLDRTPLPCSCEADINGTITQLFLQLLSGQPAFGTDMVGVDDNENLIALWHCGLAPLSMADPNSARQGTIHSNRKLPLLMDFKLKPGLVTYARLSRSCGKLRMVIGSGEITDGPKPFSGTAGLLKPYLPTKIFLDLLMKEGLEHHISLTYGDYTAELKAIAEIYNLPVLSLDNKEVTQR